eukprot:10876250-Ditylum_brightwellii.AAC.1
MLRVNIKTLPYSMSSKGTLSTEAGDICGAKVLDKENGDMLWFDAQRKEAFTLQEMATFELMQDGFDLSGY